MNISLSEASWSRIKAFLAQHPLVRMTNETEGFVKAVHWVLRTGAQWRALPGSLGKWNSVYKRFRRWSARGIFRELLEFLSKDADREWLCVDSTTIRAHMSAAGAPKRSGGQQAQSLGQSRGGFSTKLHVKVDALGLPLKFALTPGHRGDMIGWWLLSDPQDAHADYIIADTAYDSDKLRQELHEAGVQPIIPPNRTRALRPQYDSHLYKQRFVVECLINKLKWFRRIATRYDKLDETFLAFINLAACLIWLR